VLCADDQGWDDIGLHHPSVPGSLPDFIKTPNMDRFLEQSTRFDNFYVAPMCSQSRASLLTGRDFARTGTMLVNVSATPNVVGPLWCYLSLF
jgi:arylsulfatase